MSNTSLIGESSSAPPETPDGKKRGVNFAPNPELISNPNSFSAKYSNTDQVHLADSSATTSRQTSDLVNNGQDGAAERLDRKSSAESEVSSTLLFGIYCATSEPSSPRS